MWLNEGDSAIAARALFGEPTWPWRIGGIGLGVLLYAVGIRATATLARSFALGSNQFAVGVVLRWSWFAASVAGCAAAFAYLPSRSAAVGQAALEIGAASFPLLFIAARHHPPEGQARPLFVTRSLAWVVFSLISFAVFVLTLGRGLPR